MSYLKKNWLVIWFVLCACGICYYTGRIASNAHCIVVLGELLDGHPLQPATDKE